MSQIRQNFSDAAEAAINAQINMELTASYLYQAMHFHFERDDVALHGFANFFEHNSEEEREHAEKLMKYVNNRGGKVVLQDVKRPAQTTWSCGLEALQAALELEKGVNASLLSLHALASDNKDAHLCDYLESEFLDEQVKSIRKLGDYITQLKRVGSGLGEYLFDKDLKS